MKRKYILFTAFLMAVLFTGVAFAAAPVSPPVPQAVGLPDTKFDNVSTTTCKGCHTDPANIHHQMVGSPTPNIIGTGFGCSDCHPKTGPINYQGMVVSRECHDCHNSGNWSVNPAINLTQVRGAPGRPHHNITKQSSSSTFDARNWAADRQCVNCHGTLVDSYNDGHTVPNYSVSLVTPFADFKLNSTSGKGREYGGCAVCHDSAVVDGIQLNSNADTHHTVRFWQGYQCNNCHVSSGFRAEPVPDYNPEPSAQYLRVWFNQSYPQFTNYPSLNGWDTSQRHIEVRNATILAGDSTYTTAGAINGTGCEKCHGLDALHNIEANAAYNQQYGIEGQGHNGNNSDCNGCHYGNARWLTDIPPGLGASVISINSITPSVVNANVDTAVTIAGENIGQDGYDTVALVDGTPVSGTVTTTSIDITVNLAAGVHGIQVKKTNQTDSADTTTSGLKEISATSNPTVTKAELGTSLVITGAGFGSTNLGGVVINKADGRQLTAATSTWADGSITASGADAVVGDTVTVQTKTGSATATITEAAPKVLTTITVEPSSASLHFRGTQVFTATAKDQYGNPMSEITITWSSSNTKIGTVSPTSGITGSDGKVTTTFTAKTTKGTSTVSAASGSVSGSATVTVNR